MKKLSLVLILLTSFAFSNYSNAVLLRDTNGIIAGFDASTHALNIVTYPHHELHVGNMYEIATFNVDVDNGVSWNIAILFPDTTRWGHVLFEVIGKYDTEVIFCEEATEITGGIAIIPQNANRNYPNESGVLATMNASFTLAGTPLHPTRFGDDTTPSGAGGSGGETRSRGEWVAKQGTQYLLSIISKTDNNVINVGIRFYMHADISQGGN